MNLTENSSLRSKALPVKELSTGDLMRGFIHSFVAILAAASNSCAVDHVPPNDKEFDYPDGTVLRLFTQSSKELERDCRFSPTWTWTYTHHGSLVPIGLEAHPLGLVLEYDEDSHNFFGSTPILDDGSLFRDRATLFQGGTFSYQSIKTGRNETDFCISVWSGDVLVVE